MERFRVAVGRAHGVKPGNIVGAIANEAGLDSRFIGYIDIQDDYSLVDLPAGMPADILSELKKTWVSGRQLNIEPAGEAAGDYSPSRRSGNKRRESDSGDRRRRSNSDAPRRRSSEGGRGGERRSEGRSERSGERRSAGGDNRSTERRPRTDKPANTGDKAPRRSTSSDKRGKDKPSTKRAD